MRIAILPRALALATLIAVAGAGCAAKDDGADTPESSTDAIRGGFPVGTRLQTNASVVQHSAPSASSPVQQTIPRGTIVESGSATPRAGWYGITWNGKTGWVDGQFLAKPTGGGAGAGALLAFHQAGAITLWDETFGRTDGADPLSNIRDAAADRSVKTSCYGSAPCSEVKLAPALVSGMVALHERHGYRYFVTAIAGSSHAAGSYHYDGRAFDVDEVDGVRISGDSSVARGFMSACSELGAVEVLGPSNRDDHQDHIHCAW